MSRILSISAWLLLAASSLMMLALTAGCAPSQPQEASSSTSFESDSAEAELTEEELADQQAVAAAERLAAARAELDISEDFRDGFTHGEKGSEFQKYIMLHDTESEASAESVIDWWDSSGNLVAAHFVVNKDGSIVQCAPLDAIVHHAGFGDTGHNELFGAVDETRDDKAGTTSIGSWAADYGMNSYSIGIELVHTGGSGDYPAAQLEALDALIAYIDAYYGFESEITDHKAWRTGNSDTSPEFAQYLANYQATRTYAG